MPRICSSRDLTSWISRMRCFSPSFKAMCAATVSARRPASSIPDSEVRISGGTFLLSFTYCSNWAMIDLTSTSTSRSSRRSSSLSTVISAEKWSPTLYRSISARSAPSTRTLTVPSGSFSSCRIVARVPTSYKSVGCGSSRSAFFCATSRMRLPATIALSSATIDFSRPTNSGMTMWG